MSFERQATLPDRSAAQLGGDAGLSPRKSSGKSGGLHINKSHAYMRMCTCVLRVH